MKVTNHHGDDMTPCTEDNVDKITYGFWNIVEGSCGTSQNADNPHNTEDCCDSLSAKISCL